MPPKQHKMRSPVVVRKDGRWVGLYFYCECGHGLFQKVDGSWLNLSTRKRCTAEQVKEIHGPYPQT